MAQLAEHGILQMAEGSAAADAVREKELHLLALGRQSCRRIRFLRPLRRQRDPSAPWGGLLILFDADVICWEGADVVPWQLVGNGPVFCCELPGGVPIIPEARAEVAAAQVVHPHRCNDTGVSQDAAEGHRVAKEKDGEDCRR